MSNEEKPASTPEAETTPAEETTAVSAAEAAPEAETAAAPEAVAEPAAEAAPEPESPAALEAQAAQEEAAAQAERTARLEAALEADARAENEAWAEAAQQAETYYELKTAKKAAKKAAKEAAMDAVVMSAAAAADRKAAKKAAKKAEKKAAKHAAQIALAEAAAAAEKEAAKPGKSDPLKAEIKQMRERLAGLQQTLREKGLPVIVLVEGWAAAGKGSLINELISEIDPRNYNVVSPVITPEAESRYPFLYPYAKAIPENGKIMFYDSGWMEDCVRKALRREITKDEYKNRVRAVTEFERQLRDGGYVILKLFVHISEREQHKRIAALRDSFETAWRVTDDDIWQLKEYKNFEKHYKAFMEETCNPIPWHQLDGSNHTQATHKALTLLLGLLDKALGKERYVGKPFKEKFPLLDMPKLSEVDLSPTLTDEEYQKELKKLQKRLKELHNIIYLKKIPVILCYEGWDAAGKGGNIRRVAKPLDPRGCDVMPIASPEPHEKNRQYLWRFWTRLPRSGHVCIFDRTWYGRVMVERLEGFCEEDDWKRAYNEINEFERQLTDWGAVVLKFWIHIDQDTQLERFTARQNTPEKAWKLTEEDWRNREKWPEYEQAIDEMLQKTSTKNAPWYIIESNDKKYARIKALRIVIKALEKACEERLA